MSFLEVPKSRFTSFAPALNSTHVAKPGCVQCGSLLEITDPKKADFSGRCVSCAYWISDEGEDEFDDWEY
jgi:hypothetical protein